MKKIIIVLMLIGAMNLFAWSVNSDTYRRMVVGYFKQCSIEITTKNNSIDLNKYNIEILFNTTNDIGNKYNIGIVYLEDVIDKDDKELIGMIYDLIYDGLCMDGNPYSQNAAMKKVFTEIGNGQSVSKCKSKISCTSFKYLTSRYIKLLKYQKGVDMGEYIYKIYIHNDHAKLMEMTFKNNNRKLYTIFIYRDSDMVP